MFDVCYRSLRRLLARRSRRAGDQDRVAAGRRSVSLFRPDPFFSFNFAHLNRNKESLALDLKSSKGKEIGIELLKRADVFVENFRPGTADRLGLGYEALRAINPRLVYCSISAFGQTGPYANKPGFDTLGQALSGLLSLLTDRTNRR